MKATMQPPRTPQNFAKGAKVRSIYTGDTNTVARSYWQHYAGGDTSDYTVEFEEGGWNKSTNLELVSEQQ